MRKFISHFIWIFSIIFFVLAIIFTIYNLTAGKDAYFFGYKPYIIVGESMHPTIKKYGIIIVKKIDYLEIQPDDVISFKYGENDVCHRAIKITDSGITTKGDNSKVADIAAVTRDNFNGKVIFSTNILADYLYFYNEKGIFIALILPLLAIIALILSLKLLTKRIRSFKQTQLDV